MRRHWSARYIVGAMLAAGVAQIAVAQRRTPTADDAMSYVLSAFITQADPGVMAKDAGIGPELEKEFSLPAGADGARIYQALIAAMGRDAVDVRRATPEEISAYGMRRGFDPAAPHPLFTLHAGKHRFLVQYNLRSVSISFVGQLGVPDPDAQPIAVKRAQAESRNPEPVSLGWAGHFPFGEAALSEEARAKLDAELLPQLGALGEVRTIHVSGHADRMGSPEYNQRLSEERAAALRDYLVQKGVDPKKIEVVGYGTTMPVKSCEEEKTRAALIECLAANRRAAIEVQGTK